METIGTPGMMMGFFAVVSVMLAIDLGVMRRDAHVVSLREAIGWSVAWIVLSLLFAGWVALRLGEVVAVQFLTGYVIEKALSIDNLFVFLVIFSAFSVSPKFQHRILVWGIIGAIVARAVFVALGASLMQSFHWVVYLFGAFLVFTGAKLLRSHEELIKPEETAAYKLFSRFVPSTPSDGDGKFFVKENGRWLATRMFLVLVVVEVSDIAFAVDSIPAVFAITDDPFIVYTSNVFAILGLRALFFVVSAMLGGFRYLKYGLAAVLIFVGAKMLASHYFHVGEVMSLAVVSSLIAISIVASLLNQDKTTAAPDVETKVESDT